MPLRFDLPASEWALRLMQVEVIVQIVPAAVLVIVMP